MISGGWCPLRTHCSPPYCFRLPPPSGLECYLPPHRNKNCLLACILLSLWFILAPFQYWGSSLATRCHHVPSRALVTFNIDSYFNIHVLMTPTLSRKKQDWLTRWTILCWYSTCWLPQFKHCLFGFNGLEWMLWLCLRKMWPSSFQITAQSGAVQRHWAFPISEVEKDTGVEYEPGACNVKIEWRGKHKRSSWFTGWSLSTCGSKALNHGAENSAATHQRFILSHIGSDLSSLQTSKLGALKTVLGRRERKETFCSWMRRDAFTVSMVQIYLLACSQFKTKRRKGQCDAHTVVPHKHLLSL